jgi:opacity protein-like surface antigen
MKRVLLSAVCVALVLAAAAAASPPPNQMIGTWTRTVSKADVRLAHSKRIKPGSVWTFVIGKSTSTASSPSTTRKFKGQIVPTSATFVNVELGDKPCLYGWRRIGTSLIFNLESDSNPDRVAILRGTWKRK